MAKSPAIKAAVALAATKKTSYTKMIPDKLVKFVGTIILIQCLSDLRRFPEQPRKRINKKKIEEYAETMRERIAEGKKPLIKPIVVMLTGDPNCPFELISGEHRWEACKIVGCAPEAIVEAWMPLEEQMLAALAHNFEGPNPTPGESAEYLEGLTIANKEKYNISMLARHCGETRHWVNQHLALLDLHKTLFEMMHEPEKADRIPMATAVEISKLPANKQQGVLRKVFDEDLSAKRVKILVDRLLEGSAGNITKIPAAKEKTPTTRRRELESWFEDVTNDARKRRGKSMDPFHEMYGECDELSLERAKGKARNAIHALESFVTAINTVKEVNESVGDDELEE